MRRRGQQCSKRPDFIFSLKPICPLSTSECGLKAEVLSSSVRLCVSLLQMPKPKAEWFKMLIFLDRQTGREIGRIITV